MSWVNELIDLYEINSDKIGVIEYRRDMPYVLLPPFHTTVTAQITVTIDQDGNFINAELVDLNDKLTIIPVTEKSGSRTAGKEPHPLCDNLRYLAGDYTKYYKDDGICHELYISQLNRIGLMIKKIFRELYRRKHLYVLLFVRQIWIFLK